MRALHVDVSGKAVAVRRYLMHGENPRTPTRSRLGDRRRDDGASQPPSTTVGLLDESYFMYWEDLDWCYRMRRAGWSCIASRKLAPSMISARGRAASVQSRGPRAVNRRVPVLFASLGGRRARRHRWARRRHSPKLFSARSRWHAPGARARARRWATTFVLSATDVLGIFVARAIAVVLWNCIRPAIGLRTSSAFGNRSACLRRPMLRSVCTPAALSARLKSYGEQWREATFVCLALTASVFFLQHTGAYSRGLLILSGCLTAAAVPLVRSLVRRLFATRRWWGAPGHCAGGRGRRRGLDRPAPESSGNGPAPGGLPG